jgi:hypothetical protein
MSTDDDRDRTDETPPQPAPESLAAKMNARLIAALNTPLTEAELQAELAAIARDQEAEGEW